MTSHQKLQQEASRLYNDASAFLKQKQIMKYLSPFADVILTGSYALDLMVWKDIDITLILKKGIKIKELFLKILDIYFDDPDFIESRTIHFLKDHKPSMSRGYYLGLDFNLPPLGGRWKLDLWVLEKKDLEQHQKFIDSIKKPFNS